MGKKETVIIYGGFKETIRTLKSGAKRSKIRSDINIENEPIVAAFDDLAMIRPIAEQVTRHFREALKRQTGTAPPATQEYRRRVTTAYQKGKAWAKRRYEGGRSKLDTQPDLRRVAFPMYFSGRLADGLVVNPNKTTKSWTMNWPANRINRQYSNVERVIGALKRALPEIDNPALLERNTLLRRAIKKTHQAWLQKAKDDLDARRKAFKAKKRGYWLRAVGLGDVENLIRAVG